jgi:putative copper export protein
MSNLLWLQFSVRWLHILGATVWFGSFLILTYVVRPSLTDDELAAQASRIGPRALRIVVPSIVVVGITGLLLGTIFGPIHSLADLVSTAYGLTWLAAIVLGGLAFWPTKPGWMRRVHAEAIGFFGAFTAMILLHFGL